MNFSENAVSYLVIVYSLSSFVRLYFYVPQIRSVLRSNDASAIHVPTWVVWTCHNVISAAYGWFVTHDLQFSVFFLMSAVCTSSIGAIAARKQRLSKLANLS
jgi:uncharacterized protein with PQ loop repeat